MRKEFIAIALIFAAFSGLCAAFEMTDFEKSVVELTNAERKKEGLGELKPSETLFKAARDHAANMAKQNELSHVLDGKNVTDRVQSLGYKYFKVGENVAFNQKDPADLLKSWMNSPGHRENILNKVFVEIGVGRATNEKGEPYFAQVFGRPQSAGPTERARISILNSTDEVIKVRLPGSDASSSLESGGTGVFSLSGSEELPPAKLSIGAKDYEVPMKDGAKYEVRSTRRGVEITDATAEEKETKLRRKRQTADEEKRENGGFR